MNWNELATKAIDKSNRKLASLLLDRLHEAGNDTLSKSLVKGLRNVVDNLTLNNGGENTSAEFRALSYPLPYQQWYTMQVDYLRSNRNNPDVYNRYTSGLRYVYGDSFVDFIEKDLQS